MMIDQFLIWIWKNSKRIILWSLWTILCIALAGYFYKQLSSDDKTILILGKTSNGHYQIEEQCDSCHEKGANGKLESSTINQEACLDCHKEKKRADTKSNSHRAKMFEADEKADQRKILRADKCVTCHREHLLGHSGVTQPVDFCVLCHEDIADERPSHKNLPFDECGDCHNYHDNSANYSESFISKHLDKQPDTFLHSSVLKRNYAEIYKKKQGDLPLTWSEQNAPVNADVSRAKDWDDSSHALAGINCQDCHIDKQKQWIEKPKTQACKSCHKFELKGFLKGKHGMRLKQDLSAMTTEAARLPMHGENHELNCSSCHSAHRFNVESAAVDACLACHNDSHSLAFKQSKHYQLWLNKDERGVSCATCHMPRLKKGRKVIVQHNQNDNLRPKQKMAKNVCVSCHSLGFSIDALQYETSINNNFSTIPEQHIPLIEMWNVYNKNK